MVFVIGNYIYFFGGFGKVELFDLLFILFDLVYCYDIKKDLWEKMNMILFVGFFGVFFYFLDNR